MSLARALACFLLAALGLAADRDAGAQRPYRIYAITFRGMTEVERGFQEYFAARRIPVQITFRDLNRDPARMPGFLDEIRATRPDLIYTWGTSVTLGVVGAYDAIERSKHITDIPGGVHPGGRAGAREDRPRSTCRGRPRRFAPAIPMVCGPSRSHGRLPVPRAVPPSCAWRIAGAT